MTKFLPGPGELPRVVRRTANRAQAEEWAYVLTALGILHEIRDEDGEHAVAVLPEDVAAAERALDAHEAERARPAARAEREYGPSLLWLAYAALLASFHFATGPRDESAAWFARGSSQADAVLHADYAHAVGNLVAGAVLLWALARRIGPAAAAWIALGSGVLGNALTAAVVRRGYVSVGASTAVFGALGALAMLQAVARRRMVLIALGAGAALLGLLGTGHDADLFAHLFGFAAGGVLGLAASPLARNPPRRTFLQPLLALGALAALAACWKIALRA